jgi:histidine phosphotransfer protein HptB
MLSGTECHYSALCADADMVEVVQLFLDEMPVRLARLQTAIDERNFVRLASFAHQLKGAGGSYGFPQLTFPAARLEQLANLQAEDSLLTATLDEIVAVAGRLRALPE